MTTTTLHINVQRGRFAQHVLSALAALIPPLFRGPPALSQRRAQPLSSSAMASLEAQKVRELAYSYSKTDPSFAADLYAAAARHEGLYAD
jgi:hypothetical protein